MSDLAAATESGSPPCILSVFDIAGWADYRRIFGVAASDIAIVRLAEEFSQALPTHAECYRPRQEEFCALISLPIDTVRPMLEAAARVLHTTGESFLITSAFGFTLLPDEANDPTEALIVADQQLDLVRPSRERRSRPDRTPARASPPALFGP